MSDRGSFSGLHSMWSSNYTVSEYVKDLQGYLAMVVPMVLPFTNRTIWLTTSATRDGKRSTTSDITWFCYSVRSFDGQRTMLLRCCCLHTLNGRKRTPKWLFSMLRH